MTLSRVPTAQLSGELNFRNRLINSDMRIDQRNAGAEVNPAVSGAFYLDRWTVSSSTTSKFKIGQNAGSVTPPASFTNYLGITSLSAYSVPSGELYLLTQNIEGFNVSDLGWGTANAQTVTLSFSVRSSLTGTFGGALRNSAADRSYPFTYTISAANTWETKTITIPGEATGTWVTNNGVGIRLHFGLGVGSTFSGTAGAWASANYVSATGAVSVVGTSGATFYITGVQLEAGAVATPFERRPYGTELALCQRYFWNAIPSFVANQPITPAQCYTTAAAVGTIIFPMPMRANPTMTHSSLAVWNSTASNVSVTAMSIGTGINTSFARLDITTTSGLAAGNATYLHSGVSGGALRFSAEL